MRYLVMEIHPAYAVLLDEEGRFLKAANLDYRVGDTVKTVVELKKTGANLPVHWKQFVTVTGLAACLCIAFFGYYQPNYIAYGTLQIQINPNVKMTISRTERVLGLEGQNADGEDLIAGYSHSGKKREEVTDELIGRAINMGYLSDGEMVCITVSSEDASWKEEEEAQIMSRLEEKYGDSIVISVGSGNASDPPQDTRWEEEIVIPVATPTPEIAPPTTSQSTAPHFPPETAGESDYGGTDYGATAAGSANREENDDGKEGESDGERETDFAEKED